MITVQHFNTREDAIRTWGTSLPSNIYCIYGDNEGIILNTGNNNAQIIDIAFGNGTATPTLTVLNVTTSTDAQTFNPADFGVDGFSSITIEGFDLAPLVEQIEDLNVGDPGTKSVYDHYDGSVDKDGLRGLGWDSASIAYFEDNTPHYDWQDDQYIVNRARAIIADITKENLASHKYEITYCPMFDTTGVQDMNHYFGKVYDNEPDPQLVALPRIDTKDVMYAEGMFKGCKHLMAVPQFDFSKLETASFMFDGCERLQRIPVLDMPRLYDIAGMFRGCRSLKDIPYFDTTNVTSFESLFDGCRSLQEVPALNTANANYLYRMFYGCDMLERVPDFEIYNVYNTDSMFYGCRSLQEAPVLNMSSVNNAHSMFSGCYNMTYVPEYELFNVTDASYMFNGCTAIANNFYLHLNSITNATSMFNGCANVHNIELYKYDYNSVNWSRAFAGCTSLESLYIDYIGEGSNTDRMFGTTALPNLSDLRIDYIGADLDLSNLTSLSIESVKYILANLGNNGGTLTFNHSFYVAESDLIDVQQYLDAAQSKGWSVIGLSIQ